MLFRLCTRCFTYFCFQCCGLNEQIVKLLNEPTDNFWFCPDCAKPGLNAIFFDKDIDEWCQSYLAIVKPRLQNLENSNKLVLDNIRNSISNTDFNDFVEKNNIRLDAFEEGLHKIKDDLESLKQKYKSENNTILTNPVPTQINDMTPPIQTILKRLLLRPRYHDQLMNASNEQTILLSSIFMNKVMNQIRRLLWMYANLL